MPRFLLSYGRTVLVRFINLFPLLFVPKQKVAKSSPKGDPLRYPHVRDRLALLTAARASNGVIRRDGARILRLFNGIADCSAFGILRSCKPFGISKMYQCFLAVGSVTGHLSRAVCDVLPVGRGLAPAVRFVWKMHPSHFIQKFLERGFGGVPFVKKVLPRCHIFFTKPKPRQRH